MPSSRYPRAGVLRLYDQTQHLTLPTRLYKGQDVGEMLAIIVLRPQLGVEFAKRLIRSLPPDTARTTFLDWFAKALGYRTWIHALQYRTDNGKIIPSLRQAPEGLRDLRIEWTAASELLTVWAITPDGTLYHTNH